MTKIDLSSLDLKAYLSSINIDKIKNALTNPKYKPIVDNIEKIIQANMKDINAKYLTLCDNFSSAEKKKVETAFNYSGYRKDINFMEHFKKLKLKSCPFCNNNYIYFYTQGDGKANTLATLEHYYPKATYPHLSLSFYNLIPSCTTCNSKFKGSKKHEGKIAHPYYDDFDANATFSLSVKSLVSIKSGIELEVNLKSNDDKCKMSIERFHLDKIYKKHNDIAKEIWNKAQVYNEDRITELYESFYKGLGYSKEEVKNFVFCNYLHAKDIHKRNHSKLTKDILEQLEIL